SVKAVNGLVGWAAGAGAIVRRTTDGGVTWGNGNPNPGVITGDIYNIDALDANTAFVTTSPGATFIYKTTNGGTNWTQVYTVAGGFINTIKMISATNGFAFGDVLAGNWLMLKTTDGGNTWTTLATVAGTGDGRNNCLQILGNDIWFGTGQNTVWHSTNLGVNWTSATVTGITGQITGIQFNSALVGIVGGATMSKTTDGGATWTLLPASGTGTISGIEGSGNDYWYVRGTTIYRSTDLGTTWTLSHTHTAAQNDISLATDGAGCLTGWSGGTTGTIAKMTGVPVAINDPSSNIPASYKLEQNYPNPFNPTTSITFAMPVAGNVELKVYDLLGKEVASLVSGNFSAGTHVVPFDASALASGVYIYKITAGTFIDSKKMVLIK
ncbi:MAG TPA: YCF48-related protein, partial [Ignavibacteria bacterium]|nr:YCF48-related protein [Ignavibacteria bacterium]